MISLEHIRTLDEKVKKAVKALGDLRSENQTLKQKLADYQKRIEELEKLIDDFKKDQGEIEQGIMNAITQLETLETGSGEGEGKDTAGIEAGSGTERGAGKETAGIEAGSGAGAAGEEKTDAETGNGMQTGAETEAGGGEDTPENDSEGTNEKELDIF
jgi:TolA-binding protein